MRKWRQILENMKSGLEMEYEDEGKIEWWKNVTYRSTRDTQQELQTAYICVRPTPLPISPSDYTIYSHTQQSHLP